jgi:malate synthase
MQLVVKTCHRRGCFAMGGMSAMIPIKGDEAKNQVRLGVWLGRAAGCG